jgi:hypothetical protein
MINDLITIKNLNHYVFLIPSLQKTTMTAAVDEIRAFPFNDNVLDIAPPIAERVCASPEDASHEPSEEAVSSSQTQPLADEFDDTGRDPNAVVNCYVGRLILGLDHIPMNACFVVLYFRDWDCDETVISNKTFQKVVSIVAQRPAMRWLSCQSMNFMNLSVSRVRKLLKANTDLFVEATTEFHKCERFTDDTIKHIAELSVDELRRVCFATKHTRLEDNEKVCKALSSAQRSALVESWETNRVLPTKLKLDDRFRLPHAEFVQAMYDFDAGIFSDDE